MGKRFLVGAAAAIILLSGCSTAVTDEAGTVQPQDNLPYQVSSFWTKTVDGRRIPCVWAGTNDRGSLSCDWSAR